MNDNKITESTFVKKSDYKITKVHPAPTEIARQVPLYERWNNDCLNCKTNKVSPGVSVEHKQVSLNERWRDDCVG